MRWSRVKTVLIAMMLLANALLLTVYGARLANDAGIKSQAARDLADILARDGITLAPGVIPELDFTFPELNNGRDTELEIKTAEYFLGESRQERRRGNVYSYESAKGSASFRSGGLFEIIPDASGEDDGRSAPGKAAGIMNACGMNVSEKDGVTGETPLGHTVSFTQSVDGMPVFNCGAELEFEGGGLVKISGRWILGETLPVADSRSRGPASVLLGFVSELKKSGEPVKEIRAMEPGYLAERHATDNIRLTPVWKISADSGEYLVSAITLKLSIYPN